MTDERDVCRGCGVNETLVGDRASGNFLLGPPAPGLELGLRNFISTTHSVSPQSYIYNSLIFCAYMAHFSPELNFFFPFVA